MTTTKPTHQLHWTPAIGQLIDLALQEDLSNGDVTTQVVSSDKLIQAWVIARQSIVCCGFDVAQWLVHRAEPGLIFERVCDEGDRVALGAAMLSITGTASRVLRIERTLLNFLMRMCGVATLTRQYVDAIAGTHCRIVDTRKTTPGWRALDKYAVRVGGGHNHRADLGSGILIKDNHIVACGGVAEAVNRARLLGPHPFRVEVEAETLDDVEVALDAGAEVVLLDNMTPAQVQQASILAEGRALLEASGGINLSLVRQYADAGADYISIGALTHSAPAADLSLEVVLAQTSNQ